MGDGQFSMNLIYLKMKNYNDFHLKNIEVLLWQENYPGVNLSKNPLSV
jgi:hypothetical protein